MSNETSGILYDKDIREPLFGFLEETYGKVRILEEKRTCSARADVVMITPHMKPCISSERIKLMAKKDDKTNVMRVLDGKKIEYRAHSYEPDATMTGEEIAALLHEDADKVFKTLVTQGKSGQYYVFVVPVKEELALKKAAKAAGEKAVSMIKQKELLPLTGYVHGGCSPIGMKKQFPTYIHESAQHYDKIFVSAGKVGFQIELSPQDLASVTGCSYADITEDGI